MRSANVQRTAESRAEEHYYTVQNDWTHARQRLAFLEAIHDRHSIRYLEGLGVGADWQCLEVAAGGGSVAEWLCERVGLTGHVLATDIDTRFLERLDHSNLEVRRHDVLREPLPVAIYDLVHTRALLMHLAERDVALRNMVQALKPGGWLLVEDSDDVSMVLDPRFQSSQPFAKGRSALRQFFSAAGFDANYGRRLVGDMCAAGLVEVGGEGHVELIRPGTPQHQFALLTFGQVRARLAQTGALSEEDADAFVAAFNAPDFVATSPITLAVWGRKPN
jgi:SAM-dependent methyltransferase